MPFLRFVWSSKRVALVAAVLVLIVPALPVYAATITVTTTTDELNTDGDTR